MRSLPSHPPTRALQSLSLPELGSPGQEMQVRGRACSPHMKASSVALPSPTASALPTRGPPNPAATTKRGVKLPAP